MALAVAVAVADRLCDDIIPGLAHDIICDDIIYLGTAAAAILHALHQNSSSELQYY